jgi:hypothetical protein
MKRALWLIAAFALIAPGCGGGGGDDKLSAKDKEQIDYLAVDVSAWCMDTPGTENVDPDRDIDEMIALYRKAPEDARPALADAASHLDNTSSECDRYVERLDRELGN